MRFLRSPAASACRSATPAPSRSGHGASTAASDRASRNATGCTGGAPGGGAERRGVDPSARGVWAHKRRDHRAPTAGPAAPGSPGRLCRRNRRADVAWRAHGGRAGVRRGRGSQPPFGRRLVGAAHVGSAAPRGDRAARWRQNAAGHPPTLGAIARRARCLAPGGHPRDIAGADGARSGRVDGAGQAAPHGSSGPG